MCTRKEKEAQFRKTQANKKRILYGRGVNKSGVAQKRKEKTNGKRWLTTE